jgi:hypothetical protein
MGLEKPRPLSTSEGVEERSTFASPSFLLLVLFEVLPRCLGMPGENPLKLLPRRPTFDVVLGLASAILWCVWVWVCKGSGFIVPRVPL